MQGEPLLSCEKLVRIQKKLMNVKCKKKLSFVKYYYFPFLNGYPGAEPRLPCHAVPRALGGEGQNPKVLSADWNYAADANPAQLPEAEALRTAG